MKKRHIKLNFSAENARRMRENWTVKVTAISDGGGDAREESVNGARGDEDKGECGRR